MKNIFFIFDRKPRLNSKSPKKLSMILRLSFAPRAAAPIPSCHATGYEYQVCARLLPLGVQDPRKTEPSRDDISVETEMEAFKPKIEASRGKGHELFQSKK